MHLSGRPISLTVLIFHIFTRKKCWKLFQIEKLKMLHLWTKVLYYYEVGFFFDKTCHMETFYDKLLSGGAVWYFWYVIAAFMVVMSILICCNSLIYHRPTDAFSSLKSCLVIVQVYFSWGLHQIFQWVIKWIRLNGTCVLWVFYEVRGQQTPKDVWNITAWVGLIGGSKHLRMFEILSLFGLTDIWFCTSLWFFCFDVMCYTCSE